MPRFEERGLRARSFFKQLLQLFAVVAMAVGCYFFISRFFLQSVTVVGVSMAPTLADSERYLLNRWVYHVRSPRRNDLVVLRDPADRGLSVKRIVAVGGEEVYLRDGLIFINGHAAIEPYLRPGTPTLTAAQRKEQSFQCGPNQYFVLGDDRNNSVDSRVYGPVSRRDILGLIIR